MSVRDLTVNLDGILEALLKVPANEAAVLEAHGYDPRNDSIEFIDATAGDLDNIKLRVNEDDGRD